MDFDVFKDWVNIKYKSLTDETKYLILDNKENKYLYCPLTKNLNNIDNYLDRFEIKSFDEIEDYYDIAKDVFPTKEEFDSLDYIPFDLFNYDVVYTYPLTYMKDWFSRYRDGKVIYNTISDLVLIKNNSKINQEIVLNYSIRTNELYFKYVELFGKEFPLTEKEFFKNYNIKRTMYNPIINL